ncbi:hypothetical protein G9A89_012830 [Geosiphon pyriformis]|nr:hypothetical protein G9A89_012830 [Geosiphon pyriformis]
MSKKKAPKGVFHGPAVILENVKYSSDKRNIFLSKSGPDDNIYSDMKSLSGDDKDVSISGANNGSLLGLATTMPKVKQVNTNAVFGFSLSFLNFSINNDEIILFSHLPISLNKK